MIPAIFMVAPQKIHKLFSHSNRENAEKQGFPEKLGIYVKKLTNLVTVKEKEYNFM